MSFVCFCSSQKSINKGKYWDDWLKVFHYGNFVKKRFYWRKIFLFIFQNSIINFDSVHKEQLTEKCSFSKSNISFTYGVFCGIFWKIFNNILCTIEIYCKNSYFESHQIHHSLLIFSFWILNIKLALYGFLRSPENVLTKRKKKNWSPHKILSNAEMVHYIFPFWQYYERKSLLKYVFIIKFYYNKKNI